MGFCELLGYFIEQAITVFIWGFFGTFGMMWAIYLIAKICGYLDEEVYI